MVKNKTGKTIYTIIFANCSNALMLILWILDDFGVNYRNPHPASSERSILIQGAELTLVLFNERLQVLRAYDKILKRQ